MPKTKKVNGEGEAASAATGTGTGTKEKPATKAKEEVKVHTKLLDLFKKHDAATETAASFLVEIGEVIAKDNVSNPVLIKTIMEARGIKEASARSQASRMRRLLGDKESFDALKRGEVTLRAAVKSAQARRVPTPQSAARALDNAINKLVAAAKATGQDRKTIVTTVEAALEKGGIK